MSAVRDHYNVLGVTESATDDELKRAYRKLALIWHPDKNPHREEEAKKEFQFIQAAYDILSDPQERAWYDRHKDAILSGFSRDYTDHSVDILPYFTSTCYSGFDDSPESFYTIYRDLFTRIASEDLKFKDEEDAAFDVPSFGFCDSSYEEVVGPFYAYWQSYCTSKPFSWLDKYDIREADNRRILRLMEKENKKVRDQAKKERNEEVRNLVAFVRKRDKRVQAQKKLLEEKAAENARRAEENRQKQLAERRILLEETKEARRLHMTEIESQLKEIEASIVNEHGDITSEEECESENEENKASENEDMSSVISGEDLYCPACNKLFKTRKAFHNHENSKRHKENVKRLRLDLLEDEEAFSENEENERLENGKPEKLSDCSESDISLEEVKEKKKKSKKNKKKPKALERDESDVYDKEKFVGIIEENAGFSDDDNGKKKKGTKAKAGKKKERGKKEQKVKLQEPEEEPGNEENGQKEENGEKIEKEDKPVEVKQKVKKTEKDPSKDAKPLECVKCKSSYPSKNKLFEHLKVSGHATYVPKEVEVPKSKKSKKDLKRKQDI